MTNGNAYTKTGVRGSDAEHYRSNIPLGILLYKLSLQQDTFTVISILENLDRHNF
ncbi:MAG: hypothetical protein F6K23_29990 [Okeania sp. SIO2C9]|uniref:hypothetical protein n=1 Tax=Okeania sp. SIO2C9 TaxID=2607791 RepID=UPI0013BF142C|nr:hypothetical protein [Okeania sp. SIO2C9]NEQ76884.1 hypothetical protein [Okeania sp. SIO2C9]